MNLSHTKTVACTVIQHPCLKCDFDDKLQIWQDRKYDTATVTCPKCKQQCRGSISWSAEYAEIIEHIWNPPNSLEAAIQSAEAALADIPNTRKALQARIRDLKTRLRKRTGQ